MEKKSFLIKKRGVWVSPYINFRGFVEGTIWMHVVVEDYNPHHHSHTKEERVFTVEPACVFPFGKENKLSLRSQSHTHFKQRISITFPMIYVIGLKKVKQMPLGHTS